MSGHGFIATTWENQMYYWHLLSVRDAGKNSQDSAKTKNYLLQNINNAKAET